MQKVVTDWRTDTQTAPRILLDQYLEIFGNPKYVVCVCVENETEEERPFDKLVGRQFFKLTLISLFPPWSWWWQWPPFDRFSDLFNFFRFKKLVKLYCFFSFPDDDTVAASTLRELERSEIKHLDSVRTQNWPQASNIYNIQISDKISTNCPRTSQWNHNVP